MRVLDTRNNEALDVVGACCEKRRMQFAEERVSERSGKSISDSFRVKVSHQLRG